MHWRAENDGLRRFMLENLGEMRKVHGKIRESLKRSQHEQRFNRSGVRGTRDGPFRKQANGGLGFDDSSIIFEEDDDDGDDAQLNQLTNQHLFEKYKLMVKGIESMSKNGAINLPSQFKFDFRKVNLDDVRYQNIDLDSMKDQIANSVEGHGTDICTSTRKAAVRSQELEFQEAKLRPVYQRGIDLEGTPEQVATSGFNELNQSNNYSEENFGSHIYDEFEALKQFTIEQKFSKKYDQVGLTYS